MICELRQLWFEQIIMPVKAFRENREGSASLRALNGRGNKIGGRVGSDKFYNTEDSNEEDNLYSSGLNDNNVGLLKKNWIDESMKIYEELSLN